MNELCACCGHFDHGVRPCPEMGQVSYCACGHSEAPTQGAEPLYHHERMYRVDYVSRLEAERDNAEFHVELVRQQLEQARADGQRALDALVALKAAVRAEPLMNNPKYAQLAIQVNNAINAFGCNAGEAMTHALDSHAYAAVQYGASRRSKPVRQRTLSQSESANVSRLLYSFAVENGICTACRNRWATDGTRKCPKCRQKRAEQMREYRGKA